MANSDELIRDQLGSFKEGEEDIAFDKAASWQQLNSRLQPQRKKVVFKPAYRWAAAAILLIAITLTVFNRSDDVQLAETVHVIPKAIHHKSEPTITLLKTKRISIHTFKPAPEHVQLQEAVVPTILIPIEAKEKQTEIVAEAKPAMKVIHMYDLAEIENIEKELKLARYVFWHGKVNTNNSNNVTSEDFELLEQFKDDHALNH